MADPWAVQSIEPAQADPWAVQSVQPIAQAAKPKRSLAQDVTGFMANVNRGLGVGDELAAAANAGVNMLRGQPANFSNELAKQRGYENEFMAARPIAGNLARGTGMAATAVVPAGGSANVLANGSRAMNALRGATTAGLTAAGYAAADAGTPQERLRAASEAARNPLVLGLGAAGGAIGPAASRPKAKISDNVVKLRQAGVTLTPGQARGGLAKATEDASTSLPILGTAIQEARAGGVQDFNRAVGNEALGHIGESVPANIAPGHDTVAHVEKRLGEAYDKTAPSGPVALDDAFKASIAERIGEIAQDMTPEGRKRLAGILDNRVTSRVGRVRANPQDAAPAVPGSSAGTIEGIAGPLFSRIQSELGTVKGRFTASQDADQRAIGEALGVMKEELRNAAARQYPEFAKAKSAIDRGYALFKRMQGAAASPGAEAGVFTPAQYGGAVRRGDKSVDKGATARGSALGQDFADAARAVLPNKTPDSGTATRGAIGAIASAPGALIAAGHAGGLPGVAVAAGGYAATLGALKAAAKAYSPEALAAVNRVLDQKISAQQKAQGLAELQRLAANDPGARQIYDAALRLIRTGGMVAAPQPRRLPDGTIELNPVN
jgi:hypothetical protein